MWLEMHMQAPAEVPTIVPVHRMGGWILEALRWVSSGLQARANNFVSLAKY